MKPSSSANPSPPTPSYRRRSRPWAPQGLPREAAFCVRCGTKRLGYFRFCVACGHDFEPVHAGPIRAPARLELTTRPSISGPSPDHASQPIDEGLSSAVWPDVRGPDPMTAIGVAHRLPDGARITIEGVLTTSLGALEAGRSAFVQDKSGGIALYRDRPAVATWPAGAKIRVEGTVVTRYAQRTLRTTELACERGMDQGLPVAEAVAIARAAASAGRRITVRGRLSRIASWRGDGLMVTVDDASGRMRAAIHPAALIGRAVKPGSEVALAGPLARRDSSGRDAGGYRIEVLAAMDLQLDPRPIRLPLSTIPSNPAPIAEIRSHGGKGADSDSLPRLSGA